MSSFELVRELLESMSRMGADVRFGPTSSDAEIAAAERKLGFDFPATYRTFVRAIGTIRVELVREWWFYGVKDGLERSASYHASLPSAADSAGSYVPRRFIVLSDEGDFSNTGCGWIYDGDLRAPICMDGGRPIDRREAFDGDFLELLVQELRAAHDRIADADDELVGGAEEEVAARRRLS